MVRVGILSTRDAGGAGRAAYRLHVALRREHCDSQMFVRFKTGQDASVTPCPPRRALDREVGLASAAARWLRRFRRPTVSPSCELFTDPDCGPWFAPPRHVLASRQILHLHWIAEFIDLRWLIRNSSGSQRIVWTLHDMNPVTGGCHYDAECGRFERGCGKCPYLGSARAEDWSRRNHRVKERVLACLPSDRLHIVVLSRWMDSLVATSPLLQRFPRSRIPNGIDTQVFHPHAKQAARRALGLDPETPVLLCVAESLDNERKGFRHAMEVGLRVAQQTQVQLVAVGSSTAPSGGDAIRWLGVMDDDRRLALAYSAADMFLICSQQDNLPNTVVEALSCGVPVAGFAAGGIPDLVDDGRTGVLVPRNQTTALAARITRLLDNPQELQIMSRAARAKSDSALSDRRMAREYMALYDRLTTVSHA